MFGDFLGSCENHHFLSQTGEATFWATFGKTWATLYFNIWSHCKYSLKCYFLGSTFAVQKYTRKHFAVIQLQSYEDNFPCKIKLRLFFCFFCYACLEHTDWSFNILQPIRWFQTSTEDRVILCRKFSLKQWVPGPTDPKYLTFLYF